MAAAGEDAAATPPSPAPSSDDGVVIEKLHFQSRPGLYVTGNLYRPKESKGKLPAILYVCGHSGKGRDGNKTAFQDHGMWFATNGYVCLIIDTLAARRNRRASTTAPTTLGPLVVAVGRLHAGRRRVLERRPRPSITCVSRPDVDAERIGVTGISGGGAATFWIAAADERVKVAVPVSGMSDLESYVTQQGHQRPLRLHVPGKHLPLGVDDDRRPDRAAAAAVRQLATPTRIFPMDGNRRIIARLRQVYKLYDKPDLVDEYVSKGGHDYRPDLRVAVFQWINKHLKNDATPVKDVEPAVFKDAELRIFNEDGDVPGDALNARINASFVPRGRPGNRPKKASSRNGKRNCSARCANGLFINFPSAFRRRGKG